MCLPDNEPISNRNLPLTPSGKAKELIDKYVELDIGFWNIEYAKKCALIALDEILETHIFACERDFYEKVKIEIQNFTS